MPRVDWPLWLRRRSGVEHLGPPDRFFAWLTIGLAFLVLLYVGVWNAQHYPVPLGYDAQPNVFYSHVLLDQHHLPTPEQSGESNQPPAYYLVAGVAARIGLHWPFDWREGRTYSGFPEASYRGAQYLNVALVLVSALCVLWLARLVAPTRRWVWAASVAFFAFLPVVSKTEAMYHPENLNLALSTLAIAATTAILSNAAHRRKLLLLLGCTLAVGLVTRASIVFVIVAVAVGFGARAFVGLKERKRIRTAVIAVLVAAIAAASLVAVSKVQNHRIDRYASRSQFFHVSTDLFAAPWRPHFLNQAASTTYADLWGDWFGAFSWSVYDGAPSAPAQRLLRDQSVIGVLPTLLALAGAFALLALARRRPALLSLAVFPFVALAGYLGRSWLALTADGDLLKSVYVLNTAPAWAIGFGLVTCRLTDRSRYVRVGMIALLSAFAVLELRFMLYGIRDGLPIF